MPAILSHKDKAGTRELEPGLERRPKGGKRRCTIAVMLSRESSDWSWGRLLGILLAIGAGWIAVQHPHSFFYSLVKFIATPVP
jgi:hypothetical protein